MHQLEAKAGDAPRCSGLPAAVRLIVTLLVHFVVMVLVLIVLCAVVPRFIALFDNFSLGLPLLTQGLVLLSDLMVSYWYLFFLLGTALDAGIVALLAFAVGDRKWLLTLYNYACLFASILFLAFICIALGLPLTKIMTGLSN